MNYQLIYADPPWQYGNKISNGAAGNHYSTMTLQDLKRLPVWSIAAENSVLAMWYTGTHADQARSLLPLGDSTFGRCSCLPVKFNELAERTVNAAIEDGLVDFTTFSIC